MLWISSWLFESWSQFLLSSNIILLIFLFLFHYSFIHMCIHCLGHFSLLPLPPPSPPLPFRQNLFCAFYQFHWRVETSNYKKDIAFLLVEIRTAIQRFLALLSCTNVLQPTLIISNWSLHSFPIPFLCWPLLL
jgi:hypothetical protein